MSRSAFAQRFRALVGLPPVDYLARWRIHSAARILRSSDRAVASVAASPPTPMPGPRPASSPASADGELAGDPGP
jgi:hypothetical protein